MTLDPRAARPGATLALTAVSVTLAVSLGRLFLDGSDVVMPLIAIAVVVHGVAFAARAGGVRLRWSVTASVVATTTMLAWLHYPAAGWWAMVRPSTYRTAGNDISDALEPLRTLVAPVEATLGFEVVLGCVIAVIATFADAAAFRASARVQAVIPQLGLFAYGAVLARGSLATSTSLAFGAALLWWGVASQVIGSARVGSPTTPTGAPGRALGPALGAMGVAALIAVALPDTGGGGVVDLRAIGRPPEPRTIVTPLVGIESSLGALSDTVMFTVTSSAPHYWRLTTLEDFDGATWTSTASYEDVGDGDLDRSTPLGVPTDRETHTVTIAGLSSDWVPAAHEVTSVDAEVPLRYDTESSSLFYDRAEDGGPSTAVQITSDVPVYPSPTPVGGSDVGPADAADYLAIPNDALGAQLRDWLARVLDADPGTTAPIEVARTLQNWFRRDFRYQLDVDYADADNPIGEFLARRAGFCQQFATAFAAMTRAAGIPSRVAVGFTYGDRTTDASGAPTWTVRGRHAHAWPEIWTDDLGWVAFEPTPGRGNPDTAPQTGVTASQADATGGATELAPTPTTAVAPTTTAVAPSTSVPTTPESRAGDSSTDGAGPWRHLVPVAVAFGALVGAAAAWVALVSRRRRTIRERAAPDERVAIEWRSTSRRLRAVGLLESPGESPIEFARRAAEELPLRELVELGELESRRRFAAIGPTMAEARRASAIADEVSDEVDRRVGRSHVVAHAFGLR